MKPNIQKRGSNLDDFEKGVPHTTIFVLCDKGGFARVKKLTLELTDKINYSASRSSGKN
jgi:hypothetical protein